MLHFHRFLEHDIENNGNIFENAVPEFLEQLDGFSARHDQYFERLAKMNLSVHCELYNKLKLIAEAAAALSGGAALVTHGT